MKRAFFWAFFCAVSIAQPVAAQVIEVPQVVVRETCEAGDIWCVQSDGSPAPYSEEEREQSRAFCPLVLSFLLALDQKPIFRKFDRGGFFLATPSTHGFDEVLRQTARYGEVAENWHIFRPGSPPVLVSRSTSNAGEVFALTETGRAYLNWSPRRRFEYWQAETFCGHAGRFMRCDTVPTQILRRLNLDPVTCPQSLLGGDQ